MANKALHLTASSLRSKAAGELSCYAAAGNGVFQFTERWMNAKHHDSGAGAGQRNPEAVFLLGTWSVWRSSAGRVSSSCSRPPRCTSGRRPIQAPSPSQVVASQPTATRDAGHGRQWQGGWCTLTGPPHGGSSPPDRR